MTVGEAIADLAHFPTTRRLVQRQIFEQRSLIIQAVIVAVFQVAARACPEQNKDQDHEPGIE
jgi:hypothetical protein